MTLTERLARLRRDATDSDDRGFTLTEVVASMAIMTIFMVMFTASMVQLYGSSNKADAVNQSSSQVNTAFIRLDRQLRYAAAIDQPTQVGASWYVEFLTQNTGVQVCSQLKLSSGVLYERSWSPSPATAPSWNALASQLSTAAGTQPFTFYSTDAAHLNQRLELKLQSTVGNGDAQTVSNTDVSFTALNSSGSTSTNNAGTYVCTDQGRN